LKKSLNIFKKTISGIIALAIIITFLPDTKAFAFNSTWYETNKANVNAWSLAGTNSRFTNSYVKRVIPSSGTMVKIVDHKAYQKNWWDIINWYDWYKTDKGDWIYEDHLKKHIHTPNSPQQKTKYSNVNIYFHDRIVINSAKVCTKCGDSLPREWWESAENHYWEPHNYSLANGQCTICKYTYPLSYSSEKNKLFDTTTYTGGYSLPYPNSTRTTNYVADTTIVADQRTYNAQNKKWIQTTSGYWVNADHLREHNHNFKNSSGICSVGTCDSKDYPEETKISSQTYVTNNSNRPKYNRPYAEGSSVNIPDTGTAFNCVAKAINKNGQEWFKTEDNKWIYSGYITKHTTHSYTAGKCTICGYNYPLKIENLNPEFLETTEANVITWSKSYSNTVPKKTFSNKGTVVLVVAKTINQPGNLWYKTDDNSWIYSGNVKKHSHNIVAGACASKGCSYVKDLNTEKICSTIFVTNKNNVKSYRRPYNNAELIKTYPSTGEYLTFVEKVDMNPNWFISDWWYKTYDGQWIFGDNLNKHTHNIFLGKCTSCKYETPIDVKTFSPKLYETNNSNVILWERPYLNSGKKDILISKGTVLTIVASTMNSDFQLWYKTSNGYWVKDEYLKEIMPYNIKSTLNKSNNYYIKILDMNNKPIPNATVKLFGTSYTSNSDGVVVASYVPVCGMLEITASNYAAYIKSNYTMNLLKYDTIRLANSGSYELIEATLSYRDEIVNLLIKEKTINILDSGISNYGIINISCYASNGGATDIKEYQLVQNSKILAVSSSGNFTNFDVHNFVANKSVYINVVDIWGKVKSQQKLMLNIIKKSSDVPASMTFGKDIEFTIPSTAPWPLGGQKIKIAAPILPVKVKLTGEYCQIGVNFDVAKLSDSQNYTWETLKTLNKGKFKNFYEKNAIKSGNVTENKINPFSFNIKAGGYLEGSVTDKYAKGKLFIELSSSASREFQFPAAPFPLTIELSIEATLTADGTIKYYWAPYNKPDGNLDISFETTGMAYAGYGMAGIASLGIYGKATFGIGASILPESKFNEIYTQGGLGLRAKMFGKEVFSWSAIESGKSYLIRNGAELMQLNSFENPFDSILDINNYSSIDRSYLDKRTGWMPKNNELQLFEEEPNEPASAIGFDILQASTYTDITPQVATAGDTIMMVYADDNASRNAENRTMLVYSLYDTIKKEWGVPKAVNDDGTADHNFKLYSDDERIYIVWQNAKNPIADGTSIADISKQLELYVAQFNHTADAFENVEKITNNDKFESLPQIVHANGKTTVAWYENSLDDIFGRTGENKIYYAQKSDDQYVPVVKKEIVVEGATDELSDGVNQEETDYTDEAITIEEEPIKLWNISQVNQVQTTLITSLAIGKMLETDSISFTIDNDNDTTTIEDQIIKLVDIEQNAVVNLTDKSINAEFVKLYGYNALTWFNNGQIYYLFDINESPQIICPEALIPDDEYHIISDDTGRTAVLYTIKNNDSSDAYVILYDEETLTWGLPIRVTAQDKYIKNFDGTFVDGMIVSVFNQTQVMGENLLETNNLCASVIGERKDLTITQVLFDDVNIRPGEQNPVLIEVRNSGTVKAQTIKLTILDENDALIEEKTFERNIRPGDITQIETTIAVPETLVMTAFKINVSQEDNSFDVNYNDNNYDLIIGRPALDVSAINYQTDENTKIVVAVRNNGFDKAGGSIVLYKEDGSIDSMLLENFEPLEHGDSIDCIFDVTGNYFEKELYKTFNFGVITTANQYTDAYNTVSILVRNSEKTEAKIEVNEIKLANEINANEANLFSEGEITKYINGTIRNESDTDVENAIIYFAAYGYDGKLIEFGFQTANVVSDEEIPFEKTFATEIPIYKVKVFLIEPTSLKPLSSPKEIYFEEYINTTDEIVDDLPENYQILEENY
jgi:hypothetical protein